MDPYLFLEKIPHDPGQVGPYLYFEPGISDVGFATVSLEIIQNEISFEIQSIGDKSVC